jgi:hypothetical protein
MEQTGKIKFYSAYNLKGFTYTFNLLSKTKDEILSLSRRICNLGGVRSKSNNQIIKI